MTDKAIERELIHFLSGLLDVPTDEQKTLSALLNENIVNDAVIYNAVYHLTCLLSKKISYQLIEINHTALVDTLFFKILKNGVKPLPEVDILLQKYRMPQQNQNHDRFDDDVFNDKELNHSPVSENQQHHDVFDDEKLINESQTLTETYPLDTAEPVNEQNINIGQVYPAQHSISLQKEPDVTAYSSVPVPKNEISQSNEPEHQQSIQQEPISQIKEDTTSTLQPQQASNNGSVLSSLPEPINIHSTMELKMPIFRIENAQVGQEYQSKIIMLSPKTCNIILQAGSINHLDELGLYYDDTTQYIKGKPLKDGEFQLNFNYKLTAECQTWTQATTQLVITPDPRDLWQVNEPPANSPYPKAHTDKKHIETPTFDIVATRRRGRSHEHDGTFCDDDFYIESIGTTGWSVLVVADGAGSAKFSREGSRITVNVVGESLSGELERHYEHMDSLLANWRIGAKNDETTKHAAEELKAICTRWFQTSAQDAIQEIEKESKKIGYSLRDFATTLLVALVRKKEDKTFICNFSIGDGAIAVYGKEIVLMSNPDGGEYAGQTQFLDERLCQDVSRVNIRYFNHDLSVLLMTDGISDPYFETDAGLKQEDRWQKLWQDIEPHLKSKSPDQAILDWSHFFQRGHHDDRTIIVLWSKEKNILQDTSTQQEDLSYGGGKLETQQTIYDVISTNTSDLPDFDGIPSTQLPTQPLSQEMVQDACDTQNLKTANPSIVDSKTGEIT